MKKISVIMSVYDEENYLIRESVDSILHQTYEDFEFIIILDKPDNAEAYKILSEYQKKDDRIILIINDVNIGLTLSLNKGLSIAKGEYIARMDADDVSIPERFEKQINFFESGSDVDFIASNAIIIDDSGKEVYRTNNYGNTIEKSKKALEYKNIFIHPTWMFKRDILKTIKKYNEVSKAEDYDFICRVILNNHKAIILDECLLKVRRRCNGISFSNLFIQSSMADIVRKNYKKALKSNSLNLYNPYKEIEEYKFSSKTEENYNEAHKIYNLGMINCKKKNYYKGVFQIINSCFKSKLKAKEALFLIKLKLLNGR